MVGSIYEITRRTDRGDFIVLLEQGGKAVKRSEEEVRELAPGLLRAFLAPITFSEAEEVKETSEEEDSDDSDEEPVVVSTNRKRKEELREQEKARIRKLKGKGKEIETITLDDNDEEDDRASFKDEEEEEEDDDEDDDDEDASNASEEDSNSDDSNQHRRRNNKKKSRREPTRKSSRSTRNVKNLAGDGIGRPEEESSASEEDEGSNQRSTRSKKVVTSSSDELTIRSILAKKKANRRLSNSSDDENDEDYDQNAQSGSGEEDSTDPWFGRVRPQEKHITNCFKCDRREASHLLNNFSKRKPGPGRKRKKNQDAFDTDEEKESLKKIGAFLQCHCCIDSYHYGCLPDSLRKEFRDKLDAEHLALHRPPPLPVDPDAIVVDKEPLPPLPPREKVENDIRKTLFLPKCPNCKKVGGRRCFKSGCGISGRLKIASVEKPKEEENGSHSPLTIGSPQECRPEVPGFMFRCILCRRVSHYTCLEKEHEQSTSYDFEEHCDSYFRDRSCHQCHVWESKLDVILAWAEDSSIPSNVEVEDGDIAPVAPVVKKIDEKSEKTFTMPSEKDPLCNAKYLVKWEGLSYRELEWLPHAYMVAVYRAKLRNFLEKGSRISFEPPNEDEDESEDESDIKKAKAAGSAPSPDPLAAERIPRAWSTVERVLEVYYESTVTGALIEHRNFQELPEDPEKSITMAHRCHLKWMDLPYSSSTIERPPQEGEDGYEEFKVAYKAFLVASHPSMLVPNPNKSQMIVINKQRDPMKFPRLKSQPDCITKGNKLMDFQLEGVNFLFYQWWIRSGCILGDEMGLGKTVQIISLLSMLITDQGARPFLVTVPNSTIGNWTREFAKWAPTIRVVAYSGTADSLRIIEETELFDKKTKNLKTHVVIATYETLEKNIAVFKKVARWDILVVDEGQRLKGGEKGLLFKALASLNINLRILLSGTPMQNNLGELFNMLHFIDPDKYGDIDALKLQYAELTPAKVEEIRGFLKPYFLRRTKDMVLDLPPMSEVVLPVTMTPLQRTMYRSLLERNASAISSLYQKAQGSKQSKTNFNNIVMQLRKLLGHPYLIKQELERDDVPEAEQHKNLVEASAKLVLLSKLLPRLQAKGHRVLIFSQFKIVLNIIETFMIGLKLPFLRLDGDTPSLDRQRGIDAFNAKDSKIFCYLLSTRAGGAGINLATADVVILYDQDFNPQQDLQATSRAHRFGQKKPVRVFKLLVKGTCDERIFLAGNKKLGLDHMIIQRIDAKQDEFGAIEGVLQFGADAIFDDKKAEATAIRYTDQDLDKIIAVEPVAKPKGEVNALFSTAKMWDSERDGLADVDADAVVEATTDGDFWAQLLIENEKKAAEEKALKAANVGRGKRNRAEVRYSEAAKDHLSKKQKTTSDQDADYGGEVTSDDSDDHDETFKNPSHDLATAEGIIDPSKPKQVRTKKPKPPQVPGAMPIPRKLQVDQIGKLPRVPIQRPPRSAQEKAEFMQKKLSIHNRNISKLERASARLENDELNRLLRRAREVGDRTKSRDYVARAATLFEQLSEADINRLRSNLATLQARVGQMNSQPRPISTLAKGPRPISTLAKEPRPVSTLVREPRPISTSAKEPRPPLKDANSSVAKKIAPVSRSNSSTSSSSHSQPQPLRPTQTSRGFYIDIPAASIPQSGSRPIQQNNGGSISQPKNNVVREQGSSGRNIQMKPPRPQPPPQPRSSSSLAINGKSHHNSQGSSQSKTTQSQSNPVRPKSTSDSNIKHSIPVKPFGNGIKARPVKEVIDLTMDSDDE